MYLKSTENQFFAGPAGANILTNHAFQIFAGPAGANILTKITKKSQKCHFLSFFGYSGQFWCYQWISSVILIQFGAGIMSGGDLGPEL